MRRLAALVLLVAGAARAQGVPPIDEEPRFVPPRPEVVRFASGLELWTLRDPGLPLATVVVAVRDAGSAADPPERFGLAGYTIDLLDEGRRPHRELDVIEEIERDGGTLRAWVDEDAAFLAVSTLARALPHTLEVLHALVTAPPFDEADGLRIRDAHVDQIRLRPDRPNAVASVLLGRALFGPKSPYGHPALGYERTVAALAPGDARRFHAERFRPSSTVVIVVGDFDPLRLRALVEASFGAWAEPPPGAPELALPPPPKTAAISAVDVPGASQSNLLLGVRGVARREADAFAVDVLATLLGGTFGSLLNQRLREELGISYGADAYTTFLARGGRLVVATDVSGADTVLALREILAILRRLTERKVDARQLLRAHDSLVHSLPRAFDTHARTAETLAALALHRMDPGWLLDYEQRIRAVTPVVLLSAARKLFAPGQLAAVVIGDLDAIGPALSGLGLGRPVRFTPDGERAP